MFQEILMSNNKTKWNPYEALEAKCLVVELVDAETEKPYECRGVRCTCGIYAYKTQQGAEWGDNRPETDNHIWGEVWLWGRVVEHEKGYRAQYAYPKSLVNTGGIARRLAAIYGCELIDVEPTEPALRLLGQWRFSGKNLGILGENTSTQTINKTTKGST